MPFHRSICFLCLLPLMLLGSLQAQNGDVVLGQIVDVDYEVLESALLMDIAIANAFPEDASATGDPIPEFSESSVVAEYTDTGLTLVLDKVGARDLRSPELPPQELIEAVTIQDRRGSQIDPNLLVTDSGKSVLSAAFNFYTKEDVFYQVLEIDRSGGGDTIHLRIAIQEADPGADQPVVDTVEINLTEVDLDSARSGQLTSNLKSQILLQQIAGYTDEQFVSLYYPLDHISPNRAGELVRHKLSLLGELVTDPDNSSLLVTDRADYVRSLLRVLPLLDHPVPQVLVEVRILEVTWREDERLGFNWQISGEDIEASINPATSPIEAALDSVAQVSNISASGTSVVFERVNEDGLNLLAAQIKALATQGRVNLLASTQLKVLNNEAATFHAGQQIPYLEIDRVQDNLSSFTERDNYSENTVQSFRQNDFNTTDQNDSSTSINTSGLPSSSRSREREIERFNTSRNENFNRSNSRDRSNRDARSSVTRRQRTFDIGVELRVTPRIANSGQITLDLNPSVSQIAGYRPNTELPILSNREMNTTLRIQDGDSVFVAGLFQESETREETGLPVLKDIPGLGRLFREDRKSSLKTEVVFLLNISVVPR
ncbi:MAG: type II secretion system protein GspD [Verrucomicrobiota bacterium]